MINLLQAAQIPNGHFVDGMIVYGSLEKGSHAAKGFKIDPPCLRSASNEHKNEFHNRLRGLLQLLGKGETLQVQWSCNSDYKKELTKYEEETNKCSNSYIKNVRNEKYRYFWSKMEARELRREELVVFLTLKINDYSGNFKTKEGLKQYYEKKIKMLQNHFTQTETKLRTVLGPETGIAPLGDIEHFDYLKRFLNPSIEERDGFDPNINFDQLRSIQENCVNSEGVAVNKGFYIDGYYNDIFTLQRWPSQTFPGIIHHLTGLNFLDYRITLNVHSLSSEREIKKEEGILKRLQGEYAEKASQRSHLTAIEKKESKIDSLSTGEIRPYEAEFIIRVWDKTEEGLLGKGNAIKQAINNMNGAQCFESSLPSTSKKTYFNSWPGNRGDHYKPRRLYAEDTYLSDLIPFSSTFTGKLEGAEAIYAGNQGNLVGLKTFEGKTPQHTVLFGMTGAGKSVHMQDILEQTEALYDYTAIIEEGLSYESYTRAMGETPIIVQPDSELTINYFDTQGFPLSTEQRSSAVALVTKMIGMPEDASSQQLRQALVSSYLDLAYRDVMNDWVHKNREKSLEIQRLACAAWKWRREKMLQETTYLEAYSSIKQGLEDNNDEILTYLDQITESEINQFIKTPETEQIYANTVFASFQPGDFPQHYQLVDLMRYSISSTHEKQKVRDIATLLGNWQASGQYGKIFDGETNVSLKGKVAHFELGYIDENAMELKTACGLLITGFVRQHIITLPRHLRKRIIFEEVARFLDVPGGEKIVAEAYAQLRKFSCCATSIVQQYSKFKESSIRPTIMGNSKQYWIMKQMDRSDLEDMSKDINLPETAIDGIQQYPLPEYLPEENRYSSICYYSPASNPPLCGTLRNIQMKQE